MHTSISSYKGQSLTDLKRDLETQFSMAKLRKLEQKAAEIIQNKYREYKERIKHMPKEIGCQTDNLDPQRHAF